MYIYYVTRYIYRFMIVVFSILYFNELSSLSLFYIHFVFSYIAILEIKTQSLFIKILTFADSFYLFSKTFKCILHILILYIASPFCSVVSVICLITKLTTISMFTEYLLWVGHCSYVQSTKSKIFAPMNLCSSVENRQEMTWAMKK